MQHQTAHSRALYAKTLDPECVLPGGPFLRELRDVLEQWPGNGNGNAAPALEELQRRATAWADAERRAFLDVAGRAAADGSGDTLLRRAVLGCSPLLLVSGAWLQWLSAPGNADDPAVLRSLALYAHDLGAGRPRGSRGHAYLALLGRLRLAEHAVPVARLPLDTRIADRDFAFPATLLAMSRRPDDFTAEILGADLCLRTVGLLPALAPVRAAHPVEPDWDSIDPGAAREPDGSTGLDAARLAVAALPQQQHERIRTGFAWALAALGSWSRGLLAELDEARDPAYDMAELLRLRAREGAVYHHDFLVEGRPLSEWLKQSQTDPAPLLAVLAASKLVKPGRSRASSLVNGLVGERGPMFRVFSPADLLVIRRWIDSLPPTPAPAQVPPPAPAAAPAVPRLPAADAQDAALPQGRTPTSLRDAYHLLQSRADTPALRAYALDYVRGWLGRSRHGIDSGGMTLPEQWTPQGLRPWLVSQHDQHGEQFERDIGAELPTREQLIDSTVQLAPLTLIDGSWLQGFTDYAHAASEIGFSLFETYWDELGNGEPRLNHPLIYRQVLAQMGVELPPTGSAEFAAWPGFRDSSFELPVYWLCIGRLPQTFQAEVLGLNLAMELSGVGGSYRRARCALKEYGFSTRFVDIHNTIDNVATGHSAWAADAVDSFLAALPGTHGVAARAEAWERVRTGYRSLNPPNDFLARRAGRRARRTPAPR